MAPARRAWGLVLLVVCGAEFCAAFNPLGFARQAAQQVPDVDITYRSSNDAAGGDTCTRGDAYTRPQLARVSVCSRAKAVSANGAGLVTSFSNATLALKNQASVACAEAVGNAVKGLCAGGDPLATISSISSVCASALVQLQASSISGMAITPASDVPLLSPSKKAYTLACANGCMNAELSAESVAQSSACAWMDASAGCNAVKVALTSQNYAQAFIATTAAAWSNACAMGRGNAVSKGTAQAITTADVLARAVGDVVAAACSNCDTCKCAPLPAGWSYDKAKDLSKAAASSVKGQFTFAKALSQAVGSYCDSDKSAQALQAGVNTTVHTMAVILADVMVKTTADAQASGVAMSCAGGYVSQQVKASKVAFINALTDAAATVFNHQCAAAHSRLKAMTNALYDTVDEVFEVIAHRCAQADGSAALASVNAVDEAQRLLTNTKPVTVAIAEALQDGVQCGCKPGSCFWCAPSGNSSSSSNSSSSAVSAFDLGNNVTGQFRAPINWNQMAAQQGP